MLPQSAPSPPAKVRDSSAPRVRAKFMEAPVRPAMARTPAPYARPYPSPYRGPLPMSRYTTATTTRVASASAASAPNSCEPSAAVCVAASPAPWSPGLLLNSHQASSAPTRPPTSWAMMCPGTAAQLTLPRKASARVTHGLRWPPPALKTQTATMRASAQARPAPRPTALTVATAQAPRKTKNSVPRASEPSDDTAEFFMSASFRGVKKTGVDTTDRRHGGRRLPTRLYDVAPMRAREQR